jgi:uncharacterized surface protein with fasciclin (FAS1) repeats
VAPAPVMSWAPAQPATVAALAAHQPELATFTKLVQQAGLQDTLMAAGPLTVFAPSDDAFKAVPAATLDKLSRDPEFLKAVLNQHLVPGLVKSSQIEGSQTLTTAGGTKLNVSKAGDYMTIEDSLVTKPDITAGNGVVHLIDSVLLPPKK